MECREDLSPEAGVPNPARIKTHERDQPVLLEQTIRKPIFNVERAKSSCETYNAFLPFARRCLGDGQASLEVAAVTETIQSIQSLFEETQKQLQDKCDQLARQVNAFAATSTGAPGNYEHGNLLCQF